MIQIGGVYTTFCQEEGILLQKYRDRNGRCIAILFSKVSGSGVDVPLLSLKALRTVMRCDAFLGPKTRSHPVMAASC